MKGVVFLRYYDWANEMDIWLRDESVLSELLEKVLDHVEEEDLAPLMLNPVFGGRDIYEKLMEMGFQKDDKAPYVVLMKQGLEEFSGDPADDHPVDLVGESQVDELSRLLVEVSTRINDVEKIKDDLKKDLACGMDYFLMFQGDPIAYCGVEERELMDGGKMRWIRELGVHPDHREEGIGNDLLKYVLSELKYEGIVDVYIDTHTENPAFQLYRELGFETVEKEPNLYFHLEDRP